MLKAPVCYLKNDTDRRENHPVLSRRSSISISLLMEQKKMEEQHNRYSMDSIDDILRFQNDVIESLTITCEIKSDFIPILENDKSTASIVSGAARGEDVCMESLNQLKLSVVKEKCSNCEENHSATCNLQKCHNKMNSAASSDEQTEDGVRDQVDVAVDKNGQLTMIHKVTAPDLSYNDMQKASSSNGSVIIPSTEATGLKNPLINVLKTGNIYKTLQLINKERESNPFYSYESDGSCAP